MLSKEIERVIKSFVDDYEFTMKKFADAKCKELQQKLALEAYEDLSSCYKEILIFKEQLIE